MGTSVRSHRRVVRGIFAVVAIGVLVVAGFSGPVGAHTGDDGAHHHDGWMGSHDGFAGWAWGGVLWMLLWAVVPIGLLVGVGYLLLGGRRTAAGSDADGALSILRERYARGEIDEEEFESRRALLGADRE